MSKQTKAIPLDTAKRHLLHHSFGPFCLPDSELLILGSFPSVKSRQAEFYYGHPQNRFWKILAAIYGDQVPRELAEKKDFLTRHKVALYDVIESCSIIGSSDSSIRDVTVTDLTPLLQTSHIGTRIFTNGGTAYRLYQKYLLPQVGIPTCKLPSSSPANAAWSLEKLTAAWREAIAENISTS